MTEGRRPRRVAETIRKHVAEAFARELFDPLLAGLMVTRVEVGADLSLARVYVRSMVSGSEPERQKQIEQAANRSVASVRRQLASRLGLRRTPAVQFHYDDGQDAVDRVEAILSEIEREKAD